MWVLLDECLVNLDHVQEVYVSEKAIKPCMWLWFNGESEPREYLSVSPADFVKEEYQRLIKLLVK